MIRWLLGNSEEAWQRLVDLGEALDGFGFAVVVAAGLGWVGLSVAILAGLL